MKAKHFTPYGTPVAMTRLERLKYDIEEHYFDEPVDCVLEEDDSGPILAVSLEDGFRFIITRRGKRDYTLDSGRSCEFFMSTKDLKKELYRLIKDRS